MTFRCELLSDQSRAAQLSKIPLAKAREDFAKHLLNQGLENLVHQYRSSEGQSLGRVGAIPLNHRQSRILRRGRCHRCAGLR